jgi:Flp pilus assembly protein TadB
MNNHSIALALLAVALQLLSTARAASMRLAWLCGQPTPGTRLWMRLTGATSTGTRGRRLLLTAGAGAVTAAAAGWPNGPFVGAAVVAATWWLLKRSSRPAKADPLSVAAAWDLLAACLRAGLPVPTAIAAVAGELPEDAAKALRAAGDLLALGADQDTAWAPAAACQHTAALARGVRRTTRSGTALADLVADLAVEARAGATDAAEATAQRAGVLITAPLGLCFLPAFVCLGIAPVIVGLTGRIAI